MKTMTGYGFYQLRSADYELNCQISSKPSRFLQVKTQLNPVMPKFVLALENKITDLARSHLSRGDITILVNVQPSAQYPILPTLSLLALDHYTRLIDQMQKQLAKNLTSSFASLSDISPVDLMSLEGVLIQSDVIAQMSYPVLENEVLSAVGGSLKNLCAYLEAEAKTSQKVMLEKLSELGSCQSRLNERLPKTLNKKGFYGTDSTKEHHSSLNPSLIPISENNLPESSLQCIRGKFDLVETAALNDFLKSFTALLEEDDGVGKRLEYLCDRMDGELDQIEHHLPVEFLDEMLEMKQMIECLLEQAQNIE